MKMRTESEIRAYVDGYNACVEQFCECLKGRKSIEDTVRMMKRHQAAVNNVIIKESESMNVRCKEEDCVYRGENGICERDEIKVDSCYFEENCWDLEHGLALEEEDE